MIYRVSYSNLHARYGPSFIEADDAAQAKRKFAKGAFTESEMGCISAVEVSPEELSKALHKSVESDDGDFA